MIPFSKIEFINQITDYENHSQFEYQGNIPLLVVFWKNAYSNNELLFKYIEQVENNFHQKTTIYTVDVDIEQTLTFDLGIHKIPTWMLIPINNQPIKIEGIPEINELIMIIEKLLINR